MKLTEKQIHLLFKIGVLIKGIDGALETIAGIALLLILHNGFIDAHHYLFNVGSFFGCERMDFACRA